MYDYLIFIGRFQPFHNGHLSILRTAMTKAKRIIVLVGSAGAARSPKNPFTFAERKQAIESVFTRHGNWASRGNLMIRPIRDFLYNDFSWCGQVRGVVREIVAAGNICEPSIGIIGFDKDHSSYYLRAFPEWDCEIVEDQHGLINSTGIRGHFLVSNPHIPSIHICPAETASFLSRFMLTQEFKWLVNEAESYKREKEAWGKTPYPVNIICADAFVRYADKVLLVRRKNAPGKGLLALPGGHIEPHETFKEAAARELAEETTLTIRGKKLNPQQISYYSTLTPGMVFDHPSRSERGRVVTSVFEFNFGLEPELVKVKGNDDASYAGMFRLQDLKLSDFFEDHGHIVEKLTGHTFK